MNVSLPTRLMMALASWQREVSQTTVLRGGLNSQVFALIDSAGGGAFCAKLHHVEEDGTSPRYQREKKFYQAARLSGGDFMPADLRWDDRQHVVFLEWIEGGPVESVRLDDVRQAGEFIRNIQRADFSKLSPASEAALRPEDHVVLVDRRIYQLETIQDEEARVLVTKSLRPAWERIRKRVQPASTEAIVSPSDFGFHNALRRQVGGRLCFFDFEHAGMDDPAKLVCDLCVRPGARIRLDWMSEFCLAAGLAREIKERAVELLDVYRVKWACIVLGEFTEEGRRRRGFAGVEASGRREEQLSKARALIKYLSTGL